MKKMFIVMGAMVSMIAAPVVSAAPAVATPAVQSDKADENAAVNRYVLNTAAATLDIMAAALEESDGSAMAQAKITFQSMRAMLDMPVDELPAVHRAFAREAYDAAKPYLEKMEAMLSQVDAGTLEEAEALETMDKLIQESQAAQRAIEAKYPESAAVLGFDATKVLTAKIMPELQEQAAPLIQEYVMQHPEVAQDQGKLYGATFRIIANLLREMAESL